MAAGAASATSLESPKIPMMVGFVLEVVCKVLGGMKRIKTCGASSFFGFIIYAVLLVHYNHWLVEYKVIKGM